MSSGKGGATGGRRCYGGANAMLQTVRAHGVDRE